MTDTHLTRRFLVAVTLALLVAAPHFAAQSVSEHELLFREALHKQQVEGDLGAAIKLYQRIVSSRNAARGVVAKALLQLGDCYEKQGSAEARKTYERLVRDFGEQNDTVRLARARLAELAPRADARRDVVARRLSEWYGQRFVTTVSRDGRYAAIGSGDRPSIPFDTLLLLDLVSGTSRELGQGARIGAPMTSSAVSPDGSQVAYTTFGSFESGSEVRLIGVTASEPRTLYKHAGQIFIADWSRDGSTLLLIGSRRGQGAGLLALNLATAQITSVTQRLPTAGQSPANITGSVVNYSLARLSPDARYIAYTGRDRDDANVPSVRIVGLDGSSPRNVTNAVNVSYPVGWTPDGRRLLYISDASGSYDLWSALVQDGGPVGQPVVVKKDVGRFGAVGIDDNARVFYTMIKPPEAYFGELDGTASRVVNMQPLATSPGDRIAFFTWSADGKQIRITRVRRPAGGNRQWVRDAATGQEREIRPPEGYAYQADAADWTPDGRSWVTFLRRGNESKLAWIDVDSGTFRIGVTVPSFMGPGLNYRDPMQSPDGKHVYAYRWVDLRGTTGATVLVRIDVETGNEQEICRGRGHMRVSPDYSQAACFIGNSIRLVPLQGGTARDLVKTDNPPRRMAWTPDGKFLVYGQAQGQLGTAPSPTWWIVPTAGGQPRRLDVPFGRQNLTFHPDGRHVATIDWEGSGELWVLENLKLN